VPPGVIPARIGRDPPILIEADDREARSGVAAALESLEGVTVRVRRLVTGDYVVAGRCVIERKTVADFATSVMDGRLFRQAARLNRGEHAAAVILEGRWSDLADSGIRREALQGAMVSLSVVFALPVLRSLDAGETARLLVYAGQQLGRVADGTAPVRHGFRPRGERRRRLFILEGLPGIGPRRAAQLLDRFGTVAAFMQAGEEELLALPGMGPATVERLRRILHES
jgi:DNA excision repair protein ERCC-4